MNIIITGSLAYDRIMDFPGRFREHILPDKIHILNVSFTLGRLEENFGGTSGNIAHNLKLLGFNPVIVSAGGKDFARYREYLQRRGISADYIAVDDNEYTAVGNIITDLDDNQITAFYPGAHELSASRDLPKKFQNKDTLLIIAPSSKQEIAKRCLEARRHNIPYVFDPGQVIPALSGEELAYGAEGARVSIFNDYEWQMFQKKTARQAGDLTKNDAVVIITKGHEGSVIHAATGSEQIGIAQPDEVQDPTGAGDAYRAGIVAGLINKWDWRTTGQVAATIASFAVEKYGTQNHAPTITEIRGRYQQNFTVAAPF